MSSLTVPLGNSLPALVQSALENLAAEAGSVGSWVPEPFHADWVAHNNAMTVTLGQRAFEVYEWRALGNNSLEVQFNFNGLVVGGTVNAAINIRTPKGLKASTGATGTLWYKDNAGSGTTGFCDIVAGGEFIRCQKSNQANWTSTTGSAATTVYGKIGFRYFVL